MNDKARSNPAQWLEDEERKLADLERAVEEKRIVVTYLRGRCQNPNPVRLEMGVPPVTVVTGSRPRRGLRNKKKDSWPERIDRVLREAGREMTIAEITDALEPHFAGVTMPPKNLVRATINRVAVKYGWKRRVADGRGLWSAGAEGGSA